LRQALSRSYNTLTTFAGESNDKIAHLHARETSQPCKLG
jgi:hypothetical protein